MSWKGNKVCMVILPVLTTLNLLLFLDLDLGFFSQSYFPTDKHIY